MTAAASPRVRAAPRSPAAEVARSKVMAIRFVAHLSALTTARRAALAARLRDADADLGDLGDDVQSALRDAPLDPEVVGRDVDVRPFLASLAQLTRDTVGEDPTLARRADDVVRALLVHTHPAYRAAFQRLYAPFAADIGFDRLLLG